jgi:hypothetical protein
MKSFFHKFLIPLLGFLLVLSAAVPAISDLFGFHPMVVALFLTFLVLLFASKFTSGTIVKNGVEVEIWANYIIERLWKDNAFLKFAFSDDDKVLAGKIVHIPQPGAKPLVTKNRSSYPATAVRRTDTDILYPLDEYTTDPTHIADAEKVELSYNKIDSVYGDHAGQLVQDVADDAIVKYLLGIPQTSIVRTTGANTSEILTGATGTRKVFVHDDLRRCQKILNKQNISASDRYAMLSSDMADQLFESLSNTQYRDFSAYADAANGVIGKLYGFNIMQRSSVAVAAGAPGAVAINAWGAAVDTGDFDTSFVWQKDAIARAIGEVKFFENPDRAEYYGDVYSALLRFGGRRRRANSEGILAITQAVGA